MSYYPTHAFSFDCLSQKRFLKPLLKIDLFFQKSRNENKALATELHDASKREPWD